MERYRRYIQRLREEQSEELFMNSSSEHAVIVLSELLKSAKKEVLIVSQNLSRTITDDDRYREAITNFLKKGGICFKAILLEYNKEALENAPIYEILKSHKQEGKDIELYQSDVKLTSEGKQINFCVVDERAYRFEIDVNKREAIGTFNRPERARELVRHFNSIIEKSAIIAL